MFLVRSVLFFLSIVKVKYPGHYFHKIPVNNKLDWLARCLMVTLSAVDYANHYDLWWYPLVYTIVPSYPWYLICSALFPFNLYGAFTMISTYGLFQPPFKSSLVFNVIALFQLLAYLSTFTSDYNLISFTLQK